VRRILGKVGALRIVRDRLRAALGGLSPVFWVLWWATLVNRMASFVGIFLALYLRQEHGFDEAEAGWVVGLWGIGGMVASPVGGTLTDRIGRRATLLLGLTLGGLAVVAIAIVGDPRLLVVLSFVAGATQQLFFPASNAAIADVVPAGDRPRAYGLIYWAVNLGLAFGFFVAGLVPSRLLVWLFLADAATTFLCAGLIAWKVPETRPAGHAHESELRGLVRVLNDGPFVVFVALSIAALVVFTQFQLALPLVMARDGLGSQGFSWLMAFNCIGVVVLQPWLAPLLKRIDQARLLAASSLLFGLGYWVNAFASSLPAYLAGAALWTVGEVVGFPVASAVVSDLAPVELRGRYHGVYSMAWGVAMGISPIVGGQVLHRLGAPVLWWGCLATGAVVAAGHLVTAGPRRRRLAAIALVERTGAR
jgi:MFS family permease